MEFRILGPLEIVGEDGPITLHRGKEQALLAYMLLHPNEVLPSARLIDELWDERPPPTAPKILQNAVSQLRKALGDGRLETRPPGYVFHLGPNELDLERFERLASEGRSEEALALWRGPPLVDLREERFADDARRRLEDERLAVLEDRIDADLAAGRNAQLVPELEGLVAQHPLRERMQAQLMRALYASGRQADALDAYRRARRALNEELGLEPGPDLQELERKILNQELPVAEPRLPRGPTPQRRRRWFAIAGVAALLVAGATAGVILATGEKSRPLVATANSLAGVEPSNNRVVSVTPVGAAPRGVAVSTNRVWVANSADGTVSEFNANSLKPIRTIGIGAQATDLVEASGSIWVATGSDNSLVKIDERTGGRLGTIALPPADAATAGVAAGDSALWAISGGHGLKIDPVTDDVLVDHCCAPGGLTDVSFGAGAVWFAGNIAVARVSPPTARTTGLLKLDWIPGALAAGYGSLWVASSSSDNRLVVWQIDPATLRISRTVDIGRSDSFLATVDVAVGAGSVWATNYNDGTLVRIDPRSGSVLKTIHIGAHPRGIAVSKDRVWVTVS